MAKLVYQGDCITGLDDPVFRNSVASDATELSAIVYSENEDVIILSPKAFLERVHMLSEHKRIPKVELGFNERHNVAWILDIDKDIHYFYG